MLVCLSPHSLTYLQHYASAFVMLLHGQTANHQEAVALI